MALSVLSLRCTRGAGGRVWVQVWTRGAVPVGRFRPRARASVILPTVGAVKNHEKPLFFMIFHGFPKIQSRVPVQPLNLARARGAKFPHTRHNPPRTHAHTRNAGFSTHTLQTTRERCSRQEADRVLSPYPHNTQDEWRPAGTPQSVPTHAARTQPWPPPASEQKAAAERPVAGRGGREVDYSKAAEGGGWSGK